jgi:hypothetical protein
MTLTLTLTRELVLGANTYLLDDLDIPAGMTLVKPLTVPTFLVLRTTAALDADLRLVDDLRVHNGGGIQIHTFPANALIQAPFTFPAGTLFTALNALALSATVAGASVQALFNAVQTRPLPLMQPLRRIALFRGCLLSAGTRLPKHSPFCRGWSLTQSTLLTHSWQLPTSVLLPRKTILHGRMLINPKMVPALAHIPANTILPAGWNVPSGSKLYADEQLSAPIEILKNITLAGKTGNFDMGEELIVGTHLPANFVIPGGTHRIRGVHYRSLATNVNPPTQNVRGHNVSATAFNDVTNATVDRVNGACDPITSMLNKYDRFLVNQNVRIDGLGPLESEECRIHSARRIYRQSWLNASFNFDDDGSAGNCARAETSSVWDEVLQSTFLFLMRHIDHLALGPIEHAALALQMLVSRYSPPKHSSLYSLQRILQKSITFILTWALINWTDAHTAMPVCEQFTASVLGALSEVKRTTADHPNANINWMHTSASILLMLNILPEQPSDTSHDALINLPRMSHRTFDSVRTLLRDERRYMPAQDMMEGIGSAFDELYARQRTTAL